MTADLVTADLVTSLRTAAHQRRRRWYLVTDIADVDETCGSPAWMERHFDNRCQSSTSFLVPLYIFDPQTYTAIQLFHPFGQLW